MDGLSLTVCCEQQRMICLWQSVVNNKGWFVFDSLLWTTVEDLLLTVCCEQQWTVCHLQSVVSNKGWFVVDSLLWTTMDNLSLTVCCEQQWIIWCWQCCEQQWMICCWQFVVNNNGWFVTYSLLWATKDDLLLTVCCEQERIICHWQSVVSNKRCFVADSLLWATVGDLSLIFCCEQQWMISLFFPWPSFLVTAGLRVTNNSILHPTTLPPTQKGGEELKEAIVWITLVRLTFRVLLCTVHMVTTDDCLCAPWTADHHDRWHGPGRGHHPGPGAVLEPGGPADHRWLSCGDWDSEADTDQGGLASSILSITHD